MPLAVPVEELGGKHPGLHASQRLGERGVIRHRAAQHRHHRFFSDHDFTLPSLCEECIDRVPDVLAVYTRCGGDVAAAPVLAGVRRSVCTAISPPSRDLAGTSGACRVYAVDDRKRREDRGDLQYAVKSAKLSVESAANHARQAECSRSRSFSLTDFAVIANCICAYCVHIANRRDSSP